MPINDVEFAEQYFQRLIDIMQSVDMDAVEKFIVVLRNARLDGRTVWFMGNGGKAAISAEFANDLSMGVAITPRFRCVSLAENMPVITGLANDNCYEEIFSRQIAVYARPGDVVVGLSGSGHSLNVLVGLAQAKAIGCKTVALVGMDGGRVIGDYADAVDLVVHVPTCDFEDGPIEDTMLALCHLCVMRFRKEAADSVHQP